MLFEDGIGVYLIPALGGPERHLAKLGTPYPFSRLSWSADSRWIAFAKLGRPLGSAPASIESTYCGWKPVKSAYFHCLPRIVL
jgi:hypothetical protein